MTDNLGPGVSRVLESDKTQYLQTIWQQGLPPTDSDLNLMQALSFEAVQSAVLRGCPSGFLANETNPQTDFITNPAWSNFFEFGPQRSGEQAPVMWANVNGWLIPVSGTRTGRPPGSPNDVKSSNVIVLDPPPGSAGDNRIDFVFLEVWKARIQANPSTTNKPSASGVYRFGNVETGYSYLADDIQDPALGFDTTQRVQLQYRIRVVKGLVGFTTNPDGFDPVTVKAQGAASTATSFTFSNMRSVLGDPGLWRAGDGTENALGTVDGYVYAIPMAAVFRRNGVVWNGNPSQNLNGGFNRNPTSTDRSGILGQASLKLFTTTPTLQSALTASATSLTLASFTANTLPMPASPSTAVLIQVGDEIMTYSSISGTTVNGLVRAQQGTLAEAHPAGTSIKVLSTRPDGLYADQIALADIMDLRHVVNPNGMDYDALLRGNLDRLLRGHMRSNWKRSGTGPQGTFVHYQDALTAGAISLGVTQLDAPDNVREMFSDAAVVQQVECVVRPNSGPVTGPAGVSIRVAAWALGVPVNTTLQSVGGAFSTNDKIVIPVSGLKNGLQAGSSDQVRWLNDFVTDAVRLRFEGETGDIPSSMYTVTPAVPTPTDDLTITFGSTFPTQTDSAGQPKLLHITLNAVYGSGRGLARRADSLHSVTYYNPADTLLVQPAAVPTDNHSSHVGWAPLWSKYRGAISPTTRLPVDVRPRQLPVTAEMYADLGSKTIVVSPFRTIGYNDLMTIDGNAANPVSTAKVGSPTSGTSSALNNPIISVGSTLNTLAGDALVISSGPGAGRYTVLSVVPNTSITVDRPVLVKSGVPLTFSIHLAQGLMPLLKRDGATAKWAQTDPLKMFCQTTTDGTNPVASKNIYVALPRNQVPGWGEVHVPLLPAATAVFAPGVNFMTNSGTDGTNSHAAGDRNFVNYTSVNARTFGAFSTLDLNTPNTSSTYNAAFNYGGNDFGGMRFFTDSRGLGRKGLELPPFYGVARLFAVYEAQDYLTNGTSVSASTRIATGSGAKNLLRQNMPQAAGPSMWIEIDDDGDSTFILNANALDLSKSPNTITSFESAHYVLEVSLFGFDRGTFDLNSEARLVMTRPTGSDAWTTVGGVAVSNSTRSINVNHVVSGPTAVLPGPAPTASTILVNYSRNVYQGDAWGSQTSYADLSYSVGPIQTADAYQIVSDPLDTSSLTRPNQKVLEVLAAVSFTTDAGTGRLSGDASGDTLNVLNVAYSDPAVYPPTSGSDPRPKFLAGNFSVTDVTSLGTEYLGSTERLPLGALFRDPDFRGQRFSDFPSPLIYSDRVGIGSDTTPALNSGEYQEVPVNTSSSGVGSAGDLLVHVDGSTNVSLTTNYRVTRGGSVFVASGSNPGGALSVQNESVLGQTDHVNVLQGRAFLVRNSVTNVGATEVSAGDELMLLVVTTAQRANQGAPTAGNILIGTAGEGEGYSAADLYRIEGHPLVRNNTRTYLDPSLIELGGS